MNTCFKGKGSCIDLILTNRKFSFKTSTSCEKSFADTLNNQAPKKSKIFQGNQKPHINKKCYYETFQVKK